MTKSKKSIVMHGTLLCPLVLGHCAFLRANGTPYQRYEYFVSWEEALR